MPRCFRIARRWMPLVSGVVIGLTVMWWTSVQASALLPNLLLTTVSSGQVVSGVIPLSAQADAAGLSSLQFQVSGQNIGAAITSGACTTSWDTRTMSNGTHTVTAYGSDSVGSTAWTTPVVVTVQNSAAADSTAPSVSLASPGAAANVTGTITMSASASDNVGVSGVWFTVDGATIGVEDTTAPWQVTWSSAGTPNGSRVLRALARDAAGNIATSSPVTVTVSNIGADTTAPAVTLSSPAAGATVTGTVTVAANASDNVGVASVQFTLDGSNLGTADTSSPYSISWNSSGVSSGSHVLRAVARDAAGNTTTSVSSTVIVTSGSSDTTLPTVSVTAPASFATVSGTINVSASASDNVGVASVQFTLDGANLGAPDTSAPFSFSWNTTGTPNGSHTLRAVARDAAGNTKTSSARTVTVSNSAADTTLPSVSISAPLQGATLGGMVAITASASDNVGVVSVQFAIDGVTLGTDTAAPWSVNWNTATSGNESHALTATARDAAGNSRTSAVRTVAINNLAPDTTAPTINLTAPASGATVGGMVTMSAAATDNVGVVGVQFMLNGNNVGGEVTLAPFAVSWPSTGVPNGPHQVTAVARDAAGNTRTSAAITVAVANQAGNNVKGDFNSDGSRDLLFIHQSGLLYTWFMSGGQMIGGDYVAPERAPVGWEVAGLDDFNADGKSDLLVQQSQTGQLSLWAMDGTQRIDEVALLPTPTPWRVADTGDFNGDGQADILWRHPTTGGVYVWLMDGPNMISGGYLNPHQVDLKWRIAGTSDMNGDGRIDIVWQNNLTGELAVWHLNGLVATEYRHVSPGNVALEWRLRTIADMNLDGHADLVFQNTATGHVYVWYMNKSQLQHGAYLAPAKVATVWRLGAGQ